MSEELGAVLDAPVIEDGVDDQLADDGVDLQADPAAQVDVVKDETPVDWRKVPAELKELFKTPAGKAAKDAWFERQAFKEVLPEGVKQAKEILSFLDEHGGREGLTTALGELQGKAEELDGIAAKMQSGDASLITDLAASSPEGFVKLAAASNAEWQRVDPEGWGAAMSGVMAATIAQNGVPMFLEKMGMMLEFGKIDDASKMVAQLKEWANGFQQKAQATPTPRTNPQANDKFTQREQAVKQREQELFTQDVQRSVDSFREPLIMKELESFAKRRPQDAEAKELAISTVKAQVVQRMKADAGLQKSLDSMWQRGDKDGFLKLVKSRETAAIAEIAPKVGRTIFGNPSAAVTAKTSGAVTAKVDPGFVVVDKAPDPRLVDRGRTSDADIMRGKFILKDGRKLTLAD